MIKRSLKIRITAFILCLLMTVVPAIFTSCDESLDGILEPAVWHKGAEGPETVTDAKIGDYYVDTDDYKLYQKASDGSWILIMENFGSPGEPAEPLKTYVFVRYAKDSEGTDMSEDPTGRSYISILTTEKENPAPSDFTVWVKFVGENGESGPAGANGAPGSTGASGAPGKSSYTYIAFASDTLGSGFSLTHCEGLDYIGILVTDTEITALGKTHFSGKWIRFVGNDGVDGLTPYIGYDGYWWTGTEKGTQKFVELVKARCEGELLYGIKRKRASGFSVGNFLCFNCGHSNRACCLRVDLHLRNNSC